MKRLSVLILIIFLTLKGFSQNVGVGTNNPQASAILDVASSNKGLLPPRIALTAINDVNTIAAPATGLLVYNTATSGTSPNNVIPGYYFYTGVNWLRLSNQGNSPGDMLYWNGSQWAVVAAGTTGQTLTFCNGVPTWGNCPAVIPTVTTAAVSLITTNSAKSGGGVTNTGGATISSYGICYSTSPNPTLADNTIAGTGNSPAFTASMTGLFAGTLYYVRSYATNSVGTAYGNLLSFTTAPLQGVVLPTVSTTAVSAISSNSASSGGNVTSAGGGTLSEKGVCYSTSPAPTIADPKVTASVGGGGGGAGSYNAALAGLSQSTTYYARAYAINEVGIAYGNEINFTTLTVVIPVLTTTAVSNISVTTASSGGIITNTGGASITVRGLCYSLSPNPTLADNVVNVGGNQNGFTGLMTGLSANTSYFVRAFATNSAGTGYGSQVAFTTSAPLPFTAIYNFEDVIAFGFSTSDPTEPPSVSGVSFGAFNAVNVGDGSTVSGRFSFTGWPTVSTLNAGKYY